jgi:hypothetical protein
VRAGAWVSLSARRSCVTGHSCERCTHAPGFHSFNRLTQESALTLCEPSLRKWLQWQWQPPGTVETTLPKCPTLPAKKIPDWPLSRDSEPVQTLTLP